MTESVDNNSSRDAEDVDTGRPIRLLADLSEPVSDGFLDRLRAKIERRKLGAEMTHLAWSAPGMVLIELLDVLFRLLGLDNSRQVSEPHSKQEEERK